jgi:uncharacterized protein YkwD
MSRSIVRGTARALTAAVITGSVLFATAGPAMAAEPTGLFLAPSATKIDQSGITAILAKHNSARDEVSVAHLSWDDGLATDAQAYADTLATQDSTNPQHDTRLGQLNENENLAYSTGTPPIQFAVNFWYNEKSAYLAEPDKTYRLSNPNRFKWGHYTQMVWAKTSKVGCGMATGASGRNYVSCRYRAPGNFDGELPYPGADGKGTGGGTTPGGGGTDGGTPTSPAGGVNPAACAYNPGGRGGYGSYVDGLALDQRDWEQDLANAINAYRAQNGLPALKYSRTLARPAMWSSLDGYNTRGFKPAGQDSRRMDTAARVKYCSGYTGYLGEVRYWASDVAGAKWQRALSFWKSDAGANRWLLDRNMKYFAVGMAYGGNDVDRVPAYYTVSFGDH